ncbi:hypothetical protein GBA52_005348 [Prunus armeniaca]|nr:hypothetical protein GBA52_005348 [Prunus armeniaca]
MGWNVVISNHRGLGGVPITSDLVYNCGWTNDIREVCNRLHHKHPKAPLFLIGTSIDVSADIEYVLGANILVKYLGEDGDNAPVSGAAAISNPWDFLIGDRFIRPLTLGLEWYSQLHQHCYSRLANWDGKMRCIRHYHATCDVGEFETVDTFYRRTSSSIYVCNHGSHLAFFEGISASRIWWERAVDEFFKVLYCGQYMHAHKKMKTSSGSELPLRSTIDQDKKLVLLGKVVAAVALAKVVAKKLGFVA